MSAPLIALLSVVAAAGNVKSPTVVTVGQCDQVPLRESAAIIRDAIEQAPASLPAAPQSIEQVQTQLDAAKRHFFAAEYFKANEKLRGTMIGIQGLPVGQDAWALTVAAHLLEGQLARAENRKADADQAFRSVLRVEPKTTLDEDYYSPPTRAHFEEVRAALARVPKLPLTIESLPVGRIAYIDGTRQGKTPLTVSLPPGTYSLTLAQGAQQSLSHTVSLTAPKTITVDWAFERRIDRRHGLCIEDAPEKSAGADRVHAAIRLGDMLGALEVVLVTAEGQRDPERLWVQATRVNVETGEKVREGALKLSGSPTQRELLKLAAFIDSGKMDSDVVVLPMAGRGEAAAGEWASPPPPSSPPLVAGTFRTSPPLRLAGVAAVGLGVAGLIAGGVVHFAAYEPAYRGYRALEDPQGVVPGTAAAYARADEVRKAANLRTGLFVGAGVAAGAGAALLVLSYRSGAALLSALPVNEGVMVHASARF